MEKSKKMKKTNILFQIVVSTLIVLCIFYVKKITPFGLNTIIISDGHEQNMPLLYFVWDVLHGQKSFFFDWDIALGTNMMGVDSHFGLFSPLNLLYFFIPRNMIVQSTSWMLLLRIILMGLSMRFFLEKYFQDKINDLWKTTMCILYCMSTWVFHYCYFPQWIDEAIVLPICLLFLWKMLKDGTHICGYVLTLSLMLLINMQQSYQTLLFILLFSGYFILCTMERNESRKHTLMRLAFFTFLAICISSVVLLPAALQSKNSSRLSKNLLRVFEIIINSNFRISDYAQEKNNIVSEFFILWIIIILYAIVRKIKYHTIGHELRFYLLLLLSAVLPVFIESIHMIWQGGEYICFPLRNGYIIPFCTILCISYLASIIFEKRTDIHTKKYISFIVLVLVSIFCYYQGITQLGTSNHANQNMFSKCERIHELTRDKYDPLLRYKKIDSNFESNYPLIANVPANSCYVHLLPSVLINNNYYLGYNQDWTKISDNGGTILSDLLLGYQYIIASQKQDSELYSLLNEQDGIYIYKNKYRFSNGLFVDDDQTEFQFWDELPLESHNSLAEALFGKKIMTISEYENTTKQIDLTTSSQTILYVYIEEQHYEQNPIEITANENLITPEPYSNIINLGSFSPEEKVQITLNGDIQGKIHVAQLDVKLFQALIPKEVISNRETTHNSYSFHVNNEEEQERILVLPIANTNGWTCYMNGQKTALQTVFHQFIGIKVPSGISEIRFVYRSPGLIIGMIIAALAVISLVLSLKFRVLEKVQSRIITTMINYAFYIVFGGVIIMGYCTNIVLFLGYKLCEYLH